MEKKGRHAFYAIGIASHSQLRAWSVLSIEPDARVTGTPLREPAEETRGKPLQRNVNRGYTDCRKRYDWAFDALTARAPTEIVCPAAGLLGPPLVRSGCTTDIGVAQEQHLLANSPLTLGRRISMQANRPQSNRRSFLKRVGATAAAPWILPAGLVCGAAAAPSNRIATALIGSGGRGLQIIEGGDKVLAVCDVDAKHAKSAKETIDKRSGTNDCRVYRDFREVLARPDIDAVVIATPDHWHARIAIEAMRLGKAVYCEKPMTLTIADGQRMVRAAHRYGAILQVGSQQRTDEKFIRACEFVRNGRIGQLKKIRVDIPTRAGDNNKAWKPEQVPADLDYDLWLGPAPWAPYHSDRCHYNFRFVSDYSGGDVTNWGAHQLDIAQWGLGADDSGPVEVEGHGERNANGLHDAFFNVSVDFTYANGVKVELRSNGNGVRFEGTEGWVYVSRSELKAEPKSILDTVPGPGEVRLAPTVAAKTHMGIWLECIRARSPKGLNVPVEIGHRSATVCHLANSAMELGRKVKWDPAGERFVDDAEADRMRDRPSRAPWALPEC